MAPTWAVPGLFLFLQHQNAQITYCWNVVFVNVFFQFSGQYRFFSKIIKLKIIFVLRFFVKFLKCNIWPSELDYNNFLLQYEQSIALYPNFLHVRSNLRITREEAEVRILSVSMFYFLSESKKAHYQTISEFYIYPEVISGVFDDSGGEKQKCFCFLIFLMRIKAKKPFKAKRIPLWVFRYCKIENFFSRESLTPWSTCSFWDSRDYADLCRSLLVIPIMNENISFSQLANHPFFNEACKTGI